VKHFASIGLLFILGNAIYGQEYAFMYMANQSATDTVSYNRWHVVGSISTNEFSEGATSDNWSYATNRLTAGAGLDPKIYLVKFSLSFGADQATWQVGISKNGSVPISPVKRRTISSVTKDAGVVYGVTHLSLTASDYIELHVQPTSGLGIDFDPVHAQVVVIEMTDNTTNYYGGMKIENNPTAQTSLSNGVYAQLTGFSLNDQNNDWTISGDELVAGSSAAGTYLASLSVSYAGDGSENSPPTFDIGLAQGAGTDPTTIITRRKTYSTDVGNIGAVGILSISASDKIRMEVKPTTGNAEITPYYASITLYKLSGTSTAPRAHMEISSDQTQTISTQGTYYTISGFSAGSNLNDWTYSSNTLNATTGTSSAGKYLVDYSLSFQKASGTGPDEAIAAFSVFLGSSEQTELTIKRRLSSETDIGAAGGTGIIDINSASTQLTLRVSNTSSDDDLVIKSCMVNLHRIVTGSHDGSLPVDLLYFDGRSEGGSVYLDWATGSEIDNLGFLVERRLENLEAWQLIGSYLDDPELLGLGSSPSGREYRFIDNKAELGKTYEYRISDMDYNNVLSSHPTVKVRVTANEELQQPHTAKLLKTYPNPFNPSIEIQYFLPEHTNHRLDIYDAGGRLVHVLVDNVEGQGENKTIWDGRDARGVKVGSGVYFLRLSTKEAADVKKAVLLK
jgi:hypothetical protein